jgi:hypothetical protein
VRQSLNSPPSDFDGFPIIAGLTIALEAFALDLRTRQKPAAVEKLLNSQMKMRSNDRYDVASPAEAFDLLLFLDRVTPVHRGVNWPKGFSRDERQSILRELFLEAVLVDLQRSDQSIRGWIVECRVFQRLRRAHKRAPRTRGNRSHAESF